MTPTRPRAPYCGGYSSNHHRNGASFQPQSDRLLDDFRRVYEGMRVWDTRRESRLVDSTRPTDRPRAPSTELQKIRARSAVRVASVSSSLSNNVARPARALPSSDGTSIYVASLTHDRTIERTNARANPSPFAELARRASLGARNARDARADCRRCVGGKEKHSMFLAVRQQ